MARVWINLLLIFIFLLITGVAPTDANAKDEDHPWYVSNKDYNHARKALSLAKKQRWKQTQKEAKKASDPLIHKIFKWMQYTSGSKNTSFPEIYDFVKNHPLWPRQAILSRRVEEALSVKTPGIEIIEWFTKEKSWVGKRTFREPVTSKGKQLLAEAQLKYIDKLDINASDAYRMLRQSWIEGNFGRKEEEDFLKKHKDILRPKDHVARIDRLLWDERTNSAQRLMKYANKDQQKLFKARIGLIRSSWGVDKLVSAVPQKLQNDLGLLYDRIKWRAKRKRYDGVAELLNLVPPNPKYPKRWWKYKSKQIQKELSKKNYRNAYKLASFHGLKKGIEFAEAEWLSGWISLQFLNNPKAAYRHFYNLYQGVVTPISQARGAYWSGRAAEANENMDIAQSWYFAATKHPTTFYGQLAVRKLGKKILSFPKQPRPSVADVNSYHKNELIKAAFILHNLDRPGHTKRFLKAAIKNASSLGEVALIAQLGQEIGRPDYGIEIAREVSKSGLILTKAHYPILPKIKNPHTRREVTDPELALIHAIIMQESGFHRKAMSSMGARGLMQLIPRTARSVARKLRLRYSKRNLTNEKYPSYNVTIGSRYLNDLVKRWDGSYILAIASYNGGPQNTKKWIKKFGDPRKLKSIEKIIDWIEQIPFPETRNYVQRVIENLQVYRYILGNDIRPFTYIKEDLKR